MATNVKKETSSSITWQERSNWLGVVILFVKNEWAGKQKYSRNLIPLTNQNTQNLNQMNITSLCKWLKRRAFHFRSEFTVTVRCCSTLMAFIILSFKGITNCFPLMLKSLLLSSHIVLWHNVAKTKLYRIYHIVISSKQWTVYRLLFTSLHMGGLHKCIHRKPLTLSPTILLSAEPSPELVRERVGGMCAK